MNCYNFNVFFDTLYTNHKSCYSSKESVYFHCIASGHYWRTSQITELSLLFLNDNNEWNVLCWESVKEEDEYEMLKLFSDSIQPYENLIGFNSTSFHIPFLEAKLRSYNLPSIFESKNHIDLLKEIKPIGKQLHISTKMQDLRIFFNIAEEISEIESIAYFSNLFIYEEVLNGLFNIKNVEKVNKFEYLISCDTNLEFPKDIRIHNDAFYFIGEQNSIKVLIKTNDGYVRLYYPNYKDYYYLPDEDIILHKSLANTLPKEKRIKATKDNCFTFINFEEKLINNHAYLHQYLVSLFQFYKH